MYSTYEDECEAELAKAKAVPMKYKRMEFNARLQKENEDLQAERDASLGQLAAVP
jgi:hypothetical protein